MADVKKIATRESYGNTLKELAAEGHEDLVVLDADLAAATKTGMFRKAYPDRHFDCGIAEGNMMGVAAGLSTMGYVPFVSSFAMFAAHYGLSNLCVFLDRNHLQIDGTTETVMNSAPLEEKLKAFNFNVITINGHDYDQIEAAIKAFHAETEKPTCIVMDTLKGKGVSFMENAVDWHGKGPNDEEYEIAMKELTAAYAALEEEEK